MAEHQYVLDAAPENTDRDVLIAVADEIMSDLAGYLADDLTADDEQEAADIVRRILARGLASAVAARGRATRGETAGEQTAGHDH